MALKMGKVHMDLTRQKAINLVLRETCDSVIEHRCYLDISQADSLDDAIWMAEALQDEVPDFVNDARDIYKKIEHYRKELEKLHTHEIYEKGEKLGIWKLKEKQKRLI